MSNTTNSRSASPSLPQLAPNLRRALVERLLRHRAPYHAAKARDLFGLLPGSNFWLNPQSECQKALPANEVSMILSGKISSVDFSKSTATQ